MSDRVYDFEEFKQVLENRIREYLPEEYRNGNILFQKVTKSGLGQLTGMTIRTQGESIAPCLYIDSAFEEHQKYGVSIDTIASSMGKAFEKAVKEKQMLPNDRNLRELMIHGFDWNTVKENCYLSAVPASGNNTYLMNVPHRVQGDIAAVYIIVLGESDIGQMSVSVTNDLAKHFGVSEEELFRVAMQNMMKKNPPHIVSMENSMVDILMGESLSFKETFQEELELLPDVSNDDRQIPLSILTNSEAMNGAAALFSRKTMDGIAKKYPEGFYILPSSIHEAIIVAKGEWSLSVDEMNTMVKEINQTKVVPEERLSDCVHEYDPLSKSLYIAGTDAPSKNIKAETQKQKVTAHKR